MEGTKHDKDKPRWSLFPKGSLNEVLAVLVFGAGKYEDDNWMKVPNARTRYYNALMRHVGAWWDGEVKDPETGRHHLAHAACCCLFLIWFDLTGKLTESDDTDDASAGDGGAAPERGIFRYEGAEYPYSLGEIRVIRGEVPSRAAKNWLRGIIDGTVPFSIPDDIVPLDYNEFWDLVSRQPDFDSSDWRSLWHKV